MHNINHPRKGSTIKAEPIKDLKSIKRIKKALADKPRDLCLFTLGINTAYRANELLSIKVHQVDTLLAGDRLELKQSKNNKYRAVTLNANVIKTIEQWLAVHPFRELDAPLFLSRKTKRALTVETLIAMVKTWCYDSAKLQGNYSSHTLRKTFGYHQRKTYGVPVDLLMRAYGHSSQEQTLEYLCIQPEEIESIYLNAL